MIQAKCIQKFRDNSGRIYGYRLQDINGQTQDVTSDNLKRAIINNEIHVVNLVLSSDGRLMNTTEKQLQSKALGKAPKHVKVDKDRAYKALAKAFIVIDKEQLSMGESFKEIVRHIALDAEYDVDVYDIDKYRNTKEFKDCQDDSDIIEKIALYAYLKLIKEYPNKIEAIIEGYDEYDIYDTLESNMEYERASSINESRIYKSLCLIYKFAKEKHMSDSAVIPLYNFLNKLKRKDLSAINIGSGIGNRYYRYLNKNLFGTITNSEFTVGSAITESDIEEYPEYDGYSYVLHKDFNGGPKIAICALFKENESDDIQIDIKLGRQGYLNEGHSCSGIVGYIKDVTTLTISSSDNLDESAKKLAAIFNKIGNTVIKLAQTHTELNSLLSYDEDI